MRWLRISLFGHVLPLAALWGLILLRIWDPLPVAMLRLQVFDLYQRIAPREAVVLPAVIIDIDDESLAEIGQWPWPRTLLTQLVGNLFRMGAVVVGFDVIFPEPDRMSPPLLADHLPGLDASAREFLKSLPSNDAGFAAIIQRSQTRLAAVSRFSRIAVTTAAENVSRPTMAYRTPGRLIFSRSRRPFTIGSLRL